MKVIAGGRIQVGRLPEGKQSKVEREGRRFNEEGGNVYLMVVFP